MINFPLWNDKGVRHLEHIMQERNLVPFKEMIAENEIRNKMFLEYQQLKSIIETRFNSNHSGFTASLGDK